MPIAILSFNRPQYLEQVLRSLRGQVSEADTIVLVQDGVRNPYSGRVKATTESIQQCIDLFRAMVPWGTVLASRVNLGIALNYERAENYVFRTLRSPQALILEDDLVLSPQYLHVIRWLLGIAQEDRRISYVSAYGNMWASPDEQRRRQDEVQHMHENWGFAMTRQAWLDERPFRRSYLRMLKRRDYSQRDHKGIEAFYKQRGWTTSVTSQDAARWIASLELGKVRITTFACHARYIGEFGEHFTPEHYFRCGFDRTVMLDSPATKPQAPTSQQIDSWLARERARFTGEGRPFYAGHGSDRAD